MTDMMGLRGRFMWDVCHGHGQDLDDILMYPVPTFRDGHITIPRDLYQIPDKMKIMVGWPMMAHVHPYTIIPYTKF